MTVSYVALFVSWVDLSQVELAHSSMYSSSSRTILPLNVVRVSTSVSGTSTLPGTAALTICVMRGGRRSLVRQKSTQFSSTWGIGQRAIAHCIAAPSSPHPHC